MTQFADLGLSPKILKALEKTTITTPTPIQVQAIPLAMALIAGVGTLLAGRAVLVRRTCVDPASVLVISAATGIAVTLLIHIAFSYQRHLDTGWMMDAYARYYLPLVVVLPLAGLILLRALKSEKTRRGLAAFLIGGPILFGVLG